MKTVKILLGLVAAALAVVVILAVVGLQNLDKIIKASVEEVGPTVTGTPVLLEEVKVSLSEGRGELRGLSVANPEGYSVASALSLGEIVLDIDTASLAGDVVVIDEVLIKGVKILAEHKGVKDTNLGALLERIKGEGSASTSDDSSSTESDVRLAVKKFTFSDSELKLVSDQFDQQLIRIPSIHLSNIGDPDIGLTPEELAVAVTEPLLDQARRAVSERVQDVAEDKAKEKLKEKLGDKLDFEKVDKLKSLFGK